MLFDAAVFLAAPKVVIGCAALQLVFLVHRLRAHHEEAGVIPAAPAPLEKPAQLRSVHVEPPVERQVAVPASFDPSEGDVELRAQQFAALRRDMEAVVRFTYKGNAGDFSSMRFVAMDKDTRGAPVGQTGYLLRRQPNGGFLIKEEYVLEDDPRTGAAPRFLRPAEAVERLWKRFGPITDAKFQAEHDDEVREATSWQPVESHFQAFLDPAYRGCVRFFATHPGLFPGMAPHKYARKMYPQREAWVPPDLAKVDPDRLATLDSPDHADGRCPGCGFPGPHKSTPTGRALRYECGRGCHASWFE